MRRLITVLSLLSLFYVIYFVIKLTAAPDSLNKLDFLFLSGGLLVQGLDRLYFNAKDKYSG
jgi:hypothetical protein